MCAKKQLKEAVADMIELENVGPVSHLRLQIPPDGGLVILRGRNGTGKSTTLAAIQSAATGKGNLSVKDGELRGEVRAFGATVTVAQRTSRRGDVEVITLEGPGDVSTLVDPGLKSDDAADNRRIRSLLALTNTKCEPSIFWPLLDGRERFESIVTPKAIEGDDPVEMAARIKRDIDAKALATEGQRDHAQGRASALLSQNEGIDLDEASDASELAEAYAAARSTITATESAARSYAERVKERDEAAAKLAALPKVERHPDDLRNAFIDASQNHQRLVDELADLERQVAACKAAIVEAGQTVATAKHALELSASEAARRSDLEALVAKPLPDEVNAVDVEVARLASVKAQQAMERGALVRAAIQRRATAQEELDRAGKFSTEALLLRSAGRSTDDVLSGLVKKANSRLWVEAGRLILETGRGKTYFADLSHGEKWKIALDVAIDAVGRGGVLVCPQEAYEGLDPINRQMIADHLAGTGVVMFTAEATDDETVSAEVMTGTADSVA